MSSSPQNRITGGNRTTRPRRSPGGASSRAPPWSASMRLTVAAADEAIAAALLEGFGAPFGIERWQGRARFRIENDRELSLEEHPWAIDLLVRLERQGVQPISFRDR
jgi:hypothetical protein